MYRPAFSFHCRGPLSSSVMVRPMRDISGGRSVLQTRQGMPAPHSQLLAPGVYFRHGISGWFSHTQPVVSHAVLSGSS
jgi:hypothetical protein